MKIEEEKYSEKEACNHFAIKITEKVPPHY